jgi:hypothetical protein
LNTPEIGITKVRTVQVGAATIIFTSRPTEIRPYMGGCRPLVMPNLYSLFQYFEVLFVCHVIMYTPDGCLPQSKKRDNCLLIEQFAIEVTKRSVQNTSYESLLE